MAYPTPVNNQVTDAVTQSNVMALGSAPAAAVAMLYQTVAQAMGNAANNATYGQQQGNTLMLSVVSTGCAIVLAQKPK
jgi:hypothetical protein